MKIVYILEQFYLHGGGERITATKANWLVQHGYEITIICNNQKGKPLVYPLDKKINFIDLGINYDRQKSYFHPKNLIKAPKHIYKLKKALQQIKPDVIVDLSLQFDYYVLPFMTNAKTIREFHSSRYFYGIAREKNTNPLNKIKYLINDFIEKKYTYNIVLTPDEKKYYKSKNVVVIPNGIELKNQPQADLKQKKVVAAGRIAPVKGFEKLIEAWETVAKKYPDWKLEIYGDGDYEYISQLKLLVKEKMLEQNICFCGQTSKLQQKMAQTSIYVMSSVTECFPMVLLEAQAVGLPIVSFDCPYGPKNIIAENTDGLLVKNQDATGLAQAIIMLMDNEDMRRKMGNAAIKNIKGLSLDNIMTQWIDLFNSKNS